MKLRKILCLSLAAAVTFTTTISLTASAEIGGESANENQSFGSAILDRLFSESENSSDTGNNDNEGISPQWLTPDHEKIADFNSNDLPEYHIRILKCTSVWADTYFQASNGTVATVPALHGAGNYVANLEFLWYFSVFLGRQSNPTSYDDMNNKIKAARSSAIDKIKDTAAYKSTAKDNQLKNLINNSGRLVKYDGWAKKNNTTLKSSEMKMRILGYAAHLVGDVYSHRTILLNTNRLTMSYFTSNLATDVPKNIVEYRYLAKEPTNNHPGYLRDINKKDTVNTTYVDSTDYCPNRFNDATVNVSFLVTHTKGAFDYFLFLCPCSSDVKLSKFKKYVTQAGLSTSELTASEWAKYSN